jgi:hypothetical protein
MDDTTVYEDPQALSAALMTRDRAYMAKWLALQILMTDEVVCEDEELYGRLSDLQERWQEDVLAGYGVTAPPQLPS